MADSISELISLNLESAFHGKTITIGGVSKTITCERERFVNVIGDRYPFICLQGPYCDVVSRAHLIANCSLYYLATFCDNTIKDDYSPSIAVQPAAKVLGNVAADIIKLAMLDRTRGGNAFDTTWEGWDYYIDNDGDTPELFIMMQFNVRCAIRDTDPYYTGG